MTSSTLTPDPATEWINANQDKVRGLAGSWVAISEQGRLLSAGEALPALVDWVRLVYEEAAGTATYFFIPESGAGPIPAFGGSAGAEERARQDRIARNREARDLSESPLACAVADAWAKARPFATNVYGSAAATDAGLVPALDLLESATRSSPLRKVLP